MSYYELNNEQLMPSITAILHDYLWILNATIALCATLFIHWLSVRILRKTLRQSEEKQTSYIQALLDAILQPLVLIIWIIGLSVVFMLSFTSKQHAFLFTYLVPIKNAGIVFAITWAMIRFINKVEKIIIRVPSLSNKKHPELDETMVHALALLANIAVIVIGIMGIMQSFGLPISGLLAFGGIGGAGIAFASKDLLANFFGGLVIYMDKPFKVGHAIRSPDKNIEGTVEHIGWRITRIRTFDKRPLYVPNSLFLTISVENTSRMLNRRVNTLIGLRYQDVATIDRVTEKIKQMLLNHPDVDIKQPIIVNLAEFGASSLDILIDFFTKNTKRHEYHAVRHDIFLKILTIIDSEGAEAAFPTRSVYIYQ